MVKAARKHKIRLFGWLLLPIVKTEQYGRTTSGRVSWYAEPSDPRQQDEECRGQLQAVYASCARKYKTSLPQGEEPTAEGLRSFMRDRAKRCPLARGIYLWSKFEAAIEAISETAGDRDFDTFHGLLPILALLFVSTHATQYAYIVWEELVGLQTLSEAERVIFKEIVFSRTAAGTSVFADYWVEVSNRFLRKYSGRWVRGKPEQFMDYLDNVLLNMETLQSKGGSRKGSVSLALDADLRKARNEDHSTFLGRAFHATFDIVEDVNVWGPGQIKPMARRKRGNRPLLDESAYVSIDGLPLEKTFFNVLRVAEDRCSWFRETALRDNGWQDEEGSAPPIPLVPALRKVAESQVSVDWTKKFSYDEDELHECKGVTLAFLKQEVQRLRALLDKEEAPMPTKKDEAVSCVCALRREAQDSDKEVVPDEPDRGQIEMQETEDEAAVVMDHPLMQ